MPILRKLTPVILLFLAVLGIFFVQPGQAEKGQSAPTVPTLPSESPAQASKLVVYYFHGNARCPSCKKIEAYTKEVVQAEFASNLMEGQVEIRSVNVEKPENRHFVQDYQLYTRSVVLERRLSGLQHWRNLDQIWHLVHNEEAFKAYVREEVLSMLKGGTA